MTKKFGNEWQTRIGETKTIVLQNGQIYFGKEEYANTLVSAKFTGNTVELVFDTFSVSGKLVNGKVKIQHKKEQKTITLNRSEIKTVEFWQNKTIEIDGFTLHY